MSMTQVAFLRKAEIPSKIEIERQIQGLGYDFKILGNFEDFYEQGGLSCLINGQETFFEMYFSPTTEITDDSEWIKPDLTTQDTAILFVWGADLAAGACIGLISIALIDKSHALIYYLDDEIKYTREMLISDISHFLNELEKQKSNTINQQTEQKSVINKIPEKKNFWDKIKGLFK